MTGIIYYLLLWLLILYLFLMHLKKQFFFCKRIPNKPVPIISVKSHLCAVNHNSQVHWECVITQQNFLSRSCNFLPLRQFVKSYNMFTVKSRQVFRSNINYAYPVDSFEILRYLTMHYFYNCFSLKDFLFLVLVIV